MKPKNRKLNLYNVLLLAVVSLGLTGVLTPGRAAQLAGSVTTADPAYNLSALGKTDWAHWGHADNSPAFDHKSTGGNKISDVTLINGAENYDGDWAARNSASWTDGTPTASAVNNGGYYYYDNGGVLGGGFSFTVVADTALRTLYVWCGGWGAQGTLTAHLSDNSVPDYTDVQGPFLAEHVHLYKIDFQAVSAGQTLVITYVKTDVDPTYHGGSVDLMAAWLDSGEPSVAITAPANNARYDVPTGSVSIESDATPSSGRTIAKVEFFDGSTLIGTDTTSPFSVTWNNAPNGVHNITAKATDNTGVGNVSTPVTVLVYSSSLGGQIGGAVDDTSAASDLSAVGVATLDWAHWGRGSTYPAFDHKSTGGSQISDVSVFGSGTVGGEQFPISASWADGTPTTSATNDLGGYYFDSAASSDVGYSFTVPADTTVRTLYVLAGGNWSFAQLRARVSDLSAEDYLPDVQGLADGNYVNLYRVTYKAASVGQTLTVTYTKSLTANGSVDLKAAWLVSGNPGDPPSRPVLSEPAAGATFTAPASIAISVPDPTDPDGSISKVEFYDGATKLGEDATSPYSFTWNTSAKGPPILTAKAIDNRGLYTVSTAVSINIYGTDGQVAGTATVADASYNLTALGTVDWAHWGLGGNTDTFDHKLSANQISDVTVIPGPKYSWQGDGYGGSELDGRSCSWTDGAPTLSVIGSKGYYYNARQPGGGWSFTVPADTTQRTLFIYAGGYGGHGQLTAHFSDWSAQDYTTFPDTLPEQYQNLSKITYKAGSPGQTLTITYIKTGESGGPGGSIDLMAAWLVNAAPPTISLTAPFDGAAFPSPANITLSADASDDGTITKVEFFDDAIKIGEDTTSPYSISWNNAPIGIHTITAKATDDTGAVGISPAVSIVVTTTGGQLTGTITDPAPNGYDLTAQNASDWVDWGRGGFYTNVDRKATGGAQISGLTEIVGDGFGATNDSVFSASWNDGSPSANATGELGTIYCNAWVLNTGWRFTVPADTNARMLYIYGGGSDGTAATLKAHLSDGSAADFIDIEDGGGTAYQKVYAISYAAGAPGQTLTVTFVKSAGGQDPTGTLRTYLKAAWLMGPPPPLPLTIQSMKANGANLQITIVTPDAGATHKVQQCASLAAVSWSDVPGVIFTSGPNSTLVATFPKPAGSAMFYRVVK